MALSCPQCSHKNPNGSNYCVRCGWPLQQDGIDQLVSLTNRGLVTIRQADLTNPSSPTDLTSQIHIDSNQASSQQQQIFQWALLRSKIASSVYIGAVALGIIIILFGAITVFTGNILVGSLEAMSGIVIDAVTLLAHSLSAESEKGLIETHSNAIESERINTAIELTKTLEGETQSRITEAIIMRLINPTPNTQESLTLLSEQQSNTQHKSNRIREQPVQNPQSPVTQDNNDE